MLNLLRRVAALAMFFLPLNVIAFELKGFAIGQPMSECPGKPNQKGKDGLQLVCSYETAGTLANQATKGYALFIGEGKLVSAMFFMASKGRSANANVADALVEKFGAPTVDKPHINQKTWFKGDQFLTFDGWDGSVTMMDRVANDRLEKAAAGKNKNDL